MTLSDLQTQLEDLNIYYSQLISQWNTTEPYYTGTFDVELPVGVETQLIVPATGRNAVDVPANQIVRATVVVSRERMASQRNALAARHDDAVEAWYQAFLEEMRVTAETPPLHEFTKRQYLRGQACFIGPFFDLDLYENGAPGAIWADSEDPYIMRIPPGRSPRAFFIDYQMTAWELEERAGIDPYFRGWKRQGRRGSTLIRIAEAYWMEGVGAEAECGHAVWEYGGDDYIQPPRPTGYHYLPLVRAYSGYGLRGVGLAPEQLSEGILNRQTRSLIRAEAYDHTAASVAVAGSAWRRIVVDRPELIGQVDPQFGAATVSIMPPGAQFAEQDPIPPAAIQELQITNTKLAEALFPGVVAGQAIGVRTATGQAMATMEAKKKFDPPTWLAERALERLLYNTGQLVADLAARKGFPDEFTIRGHSIRARDFGGDFSCHVSITPEDTEANARDTQQGLMLLERNAMSEEEVHKRYFHNEDYKGDLTRRVREGVIKQYAIPFVAERAGLLVQAQLAEQKGPGGANVPVRQQPGGGLATVRQINQMAQQTRALRAGTPPTMPGTVEADAQFARQVQGPPPGGGYA